MNTKTIQAVSRLFLLAAVLCPSLASAASATQPSREWVPLQAAAPETARARVLDARRASEIRLTTAVPGLWWNRRASSASPRLAADAAAPLQADSFDYLEIPDFSCLQEVGKPRLPAQIHLLAIPNGVKPRVELIPIRSTQLRDIQIVPMQELPPDVYPAPPAAPFALNSATYQDTAPYPPNPIVETEIIGLRDQTLLRIVVAPVQVRPADATAEVTYEYEVTVTWDAADAEPPLLPDSSALPVYMILAPDTLATNAALLSLAEWKKRKGLDVRLVKTSQINTNGVPGNAEIVTYMRALSTNDYPLYLLIVGGHSATNGVAGAYFNTDTTTYYGYTDLDIACRNTNDFFPDLYHGRLPALTQAELTAMVNKILLMDRTPPASSMFQKACVAGQIQDNDPKNGMADRLFCETADSIARYFEAQTGGISYSCVRAVVNPDGIAATGTWNSASILWNSTNRITDRIYTQFVSVATAQSRISAQINSGIALLQHRDHGYVNGVGWGDPNYQYTHVNALTNGSNQPVVFSINCNSGMYNFPNNFARSWLIKTNGGAYAVFAPVDTSYSWLNDWLTHGFYAAFLGDYISAHNASTEPEWPKNLPEPAGIYGASGSARNLGQILNFGKFYMAEKYSAHQTTFRLFHLFGDPESQLRLITPQSNAVSHPSSLQVTVSAVTVTVASAASTVCLYSPGLGLHATASPSSGKTVFPLSLTNSGTLHVTVTGPDLRPYEGQISVFRGDAPFSFRATPLTNSVMLRWSDPRDSGAATPDVRIRSSTDDYPADAGAGRAVYAGQAQSFLDTSLTNSTTYYYSIWVTDDGVAFREP